MRTARSIGRNLMNKKNSKDLAFQAGSLVLFCCMFLADPYFRMSINNQRRQRDLSPFFCGIVLAQKRLGGLVENYKTKEAILFGMSIDNAISSLYNRSA